MAPGEIIRIGINGSGVIGNATLRNLVERDLLGKRVQIVAINDPKFDPATRASMVGNLKNDSVYGKFPGTVLIDGEKLVINDREMPIFSTMDVPRWGDLGADIVIDASGQRVNTPEQIKPHFDAGAKKVIITAPAKNADITIVMSVNDGSYDPAAHNVISNASCTTNCLAPAAWVIHTQFGIIVSDMVTIHSYTNDQRLQDGPHKDPRRARGGATSSIPTSTGAAKAIGLVIPGLSPLEVEGIEGKVAPMTGFAMRIPQNAVSSVAFVFQTEREMSLEALNAALKLASEEGRFAGTLGYFMKDPLVSHDFVGDTRASIVDAEYTMVNMLTGKFGRVLLWYDNVAGYVNQLVKAVLMVGDKL